MSEHDYPRMIPGDDLDDAQIEALEREVAEEAIAVQLALEQAGAWRSAQDCWLEAREIVMARHRA